MVQYGPGGFGLVVIVVTVKQFSSQCGCETAETLKACAR